MKISTQRLSSASRERLPSPARSLLSCLLLALAISLPSPALALRENWLNWGSWGEDKANLVAVWGSSANDIFAVGRRGPILHYDGETWKGMSTGTIDYTSRELHLDDVWGTGPDDVYALGCFLPEFSVCLEDTVIHYDGTSWKSVLLSEPSTLSSIWGSSADDVYVVGGDRMWHFDGNIWSHVDLGTADPGALTRVWGTGSNDVYAVGPDGVILHYDGSSWTPMDSHTTDHLGPMWGSSGSDVFVLGGPGTIVHYDGSSWTPMDSGTTERLVDIWGSSGTDVFAVGDSGAIVHYDDSSWTPMDSGTSEDLVDLWGSGPDDVFAVGNGGMFLHYNGSSWTGTRVEDGTLNALWGSSTGEVFAVGSATTILHYQSGSWTVTSASAFVDLWALWGSSASDVFAVGPDGVIQHYGGSWSTMDSGTSEDLRGAWGSSGSDVFAVGSSGTILHYDGSSWAPMASGTSVRINDVWGSSGSDVFAVGQNDTIFGPILHYDGGSWTHMAPASSETLQGIWGSSGSDVFAVGWHDIVHYDGSSWTLAYSNDDVSLSDIWGSSGTDVFAVGTVFVGSGEDLELEPLILHYNGSIWHPMAWELPPWFNGSGFDAVWGTSSTDVYVVGNNTGPDAYYYGIVLHYDGTTWRVDEYLPVSFWDVWTDASGEALAVLDRYTFRQQGFPPAPPPPETQWAGTYGGLSNDRAKAVRQTADGGYILVGETESFGASDSDAWVLKLDRDGNVEWERRYGGPQGDGAADVLQTQDGRYIVAGHTASFGAGSTDMWVLELSPAGDVVWQRAYGGVGADRAVAVEKRNVHTGYAVAGTTTSFGAGETDFWMISLDPQGSILDQMTWGAADVESLTSFEPTSTLGYIAAGTTYSFGGNAELWVVDFELKLNIYSYDLELDVNWEKTYGLRSFVPPDQWNANSDYAPQIAQTADGGYILAATSAPVDVNSLAWVLKLDSKGNVEWQKSYSWFIDHDVSSVFQTDDLGFIVAGSMPGMVGVEPVGYGWIMKLDAAGNPEWQQTYGNAGFGHDESLASIRPAADGGLIAAGRTTSGGVGESSDVWVLKLDANGEIPDCAALLERWIGGAVDTSEGGVDREGTALSDFPSREIATAAVAEDTEALLGEGCGFRVLEPLIGLPRTGQAQAHYPGDDGHLQVGAVWPDPRFTVTYCAADAPCADQGSDCDGDPETDMVTDELTGLVWARHASLADGMLTWQEALDYVTSGVNAGPGLCGSTDWRMPNIHELESLLNAAAPDQATWLHGQGFTGVVSAEDEFYWSSTAYADGGPRKWIAKMSDGSLGNLPTWWTLHVWPVRAGQPDSPVADFPANVWKTGQTESDYPGDDGDLQMGIAWPNQRFTDNADGTVTDNLTGLMWLKDANCAGTIGHDPDGALHAGAMSWESALDFVAAVNAGTIDISVCGSYTDDYRDWRLANRKELFSLVDRSRVSPALPSGHPYENLPDGAVMHSGYWSSTTFPSYTGHVWTTELWPGYMYDWPKQYNTDFVWLVRHGEDSDRDGLTDSLEEASCTDPSDADSDDDGLRDGAEDANRNSALDPGETDPCSADSDGDGIQDGTELGHAVGVPDPDGAGPLEGTDPALFVPDQDPTTTTDPLDADSDDDGLTDGEEDANADGSRDATETDPMDPDSDDDLFSDWVELAAGTNPLDPDSYPVGDFRTSVINEIMTSYDGDSDVQFVEIHQPSLWDDVTNTVLAAFDADGAYLGDVWVLPSAPSSQIWTLGTQELEVGYGFQPDFVIPAALPTGAGMVCWGAPDAPAPDPGTWDHGDPENYVDCVAYGGYAGPSNSRIGSASPHIADGHSLTRAPGSLGVGDNAGDFFCANPATPEGSRGAQAGFLPATQPCPVPAIFTLLEPLAFSGEGVSGSVNPVSSLGAISGDPDCTHLSPCLFPFGDTFVFSVTLEEGSASVDAVGAWPFSSAAAGYFPDDNATGPSPIAIFDFALGKGHIFRQPRGGEGAALLAGQTTEVLFVGAPTGSIATASPPDDEMRFRIWKTSDVVIVEFDTDPARIPEPASALLALAALGSLATLARRRRGREG